jgi:hypothetical protein
MGQFVQSELLGSRESAVAQAIISMQDRLVELGSYPIVPELAFTPNDRAIWTTGF